MAAPPTPTAQAQADLDRALAAALAGRCAPLRLDREAHGAFARTACKPPPGGYAAGVPDVVGAARRPDARAARPCISGSRRKPFPRAPASP